MDYDVVVVGGGPAGYVAAIRAGQLGHRTVLVEKEHLGGMCLNWGCIPSKALLESAKRLEDVRTASEFGVSGLDMEALAFDWSKASLRAGRLVRRLTKGVESLLKKNNVEIVKGEAVIDSVHEVSVNNRMLSSRYIVLATGTLPVLPEDIPVSSETIFPFTELLRQTHLPQRPLILGDGPSAVEMAQFFSMVGAAPLLLRRHDRLIPMADPLVSETATRLLDKKKVQIRSFTELLWEGAKQTVASGDWRFQYDALINLADRRAIMPKTGGFALEMKNGFPLVDEYLRTSQENIYAVGDVNGLSVFAHAASAQGLFAINHLSGIKGEYPPKAVPINIYTWPEIAQVGLGELQLKETGVEYKSADFPLSANGKAMAEGHADGLLRIHFEPRYGEILGVVIVAPHATDMIAEAVSLIELEATVADAARMVHAHPTVSEVMMEAAFVALDSPIHR